VKCLKSEFLLYIGWSESGKITLNETLLFTMYKQVSFVDSMLLRRLQTLRVCSQGGSTWSDVIVAILKCDIKSKIWFRMSIDAYFLGAHSWQISSGSGLKRRGLRIFLTRTPQQEQEHREQDEISFFYLKMEVCRFQSTETVVPSYYILGPP